MRKIFPSKFEWGVTENAGELIDSLNFNNQLIHNLQSRGINALLLNISWKDLILDEEGNVCEETASHYENLFKQIKEDNFKLTIILLSSDLPEYVREKGGLINRDFIYQFEKYANVCYERFGQYVDNWITIRDPALFVYLNPRFKKIDKFKTRINLAITEIHHLLTAHGLAVMSFRDKGYEGKIGIMLSVINFIPSFFKFKDIMLNIFAKTLYNKWFTRSISQGTYPFFTSLILHFCGVKTFFRKSDMGIISAAPNFIFLNYYGKASIKNINGLFNVDNIQINSNTKEEDYISALTSMYKSIRIPIYINDISTNDTEKTMDKCQQIHIEKNIKTIELMLLNWVDIRGYYIESLFERSYREKIKARSGLFYKDLETGKIKEKQSLDKYAALIKERI